MADPESLVTIATFFRLEEAQVAHARLEAEEIESFLNGEAFAQAMWHLTQAIGGVRLQVAAQDEERARAVIEDRSELEPVEEFSTEVQLPDGTAAREKLVERAYRGAIIGVVLCPALMHFYSLVQLNEYRVGTAPVSAQTQRRARIAFAIDVAALAVTALLLIAINVHRLNDR